MKNFLKPIKMVSEAREQGKQNSPSKEFLCVMIVYLSATFICNFIYILISSFYCLNNESFLNLFLDANVDYQVLVETMINLALTAPEWLKMVPLFLTAFYVLGAFVYCKFIDKRSIATLGLRKANVLSETVVGMLLGLCVVSFVAFCGVLTGSFSFDGFNGISPKVLIAYVLGYLIYALFEEVLIHGCYMVGVAKKSSPVYAIVLSSILYMLISFVNYGSSFVAFVNQFIFAIVTGIYVFKRGNIWGTIGFNFAVNFVFNVVFGFNFEGNVNTSSIFSVSSVKGFDSLNGGSLGAESGLFMTLAMFILFGLVIKLRQNEKEIVLVENADEKDI